MIISRTPFRITLGGGGTDLPSYYTKRGGFVLATTISKFMNIIVSEPFDDLIRVKYSESEIVKHPSELRHKSARVILHHVGIEKKIDIVSLADIPGEGTGLGSSSAYIVGLLTALYCLKNVADLSLYDIAEIANKIESGALCQPCGKQDHFMATFGGLKVLEIAKDGSVNVSSVNPTCDIDLLDRNLLAFYTNITRSSYDILIEQSNRIKNDINNTMYIMDCIKEIGYRIYGAIKSGNFTDVGLLFDDHWKLKRSISNQMSNDRIDEIYDFALENGALGGKIVGGGGGGFLLFYVESDHYKFIKTMEKTGMRYVDFNFEPKGTRIILNE